VLDVEFGPDGDVDPLACDLDLELLSLFERVRQPPQLRDELGGAVNLLDISLRLAAHAIPHFHKASHMYVMPTESIALESSPLQRRPSHPDFRLVSRADLRELEAVGRVKHVLRVSTVRDQHGNRDTVTAEFKLGRILDAGMLDRRLQTEIPVTPHLDLQLTLAGVMR
jgi:hypothetical protein